MRIVLSVHPWLYHVLVARNPLLQASAYQQRSSVSDRGNQLEFYKPSHQHLYQGEIGNWSFEFFGSDVDIRSGSPW